MSKGFGRLVRRPRSIAIGLPPFHWLRTNVSDRCRLRRHQSRRDRAARKRARAAPRTDRDPTATGVQPYPKLPFPMASWSSIFTASRTRWGSQHPGTISPRTGLLKNSNTLCLNGRPLRNDLEQVFRRKIEIENDANCFALAEALLGAGKRKKLSVRSYSGHGLRGRYRPQRRVGHRRTTHCRRIGHAHRSRNGHAASASYAGVQKPTSAEAKSRRVTRKDAEPSGRSEKSR